MEDLNKNNIFEMTQNETKELQKYFSATFSNDSFGNTTIKEFLDSGYLMDPHTAVAYAVYHRLRREGKIERHSHTVIISTAHPYKFPGIVAEILGLDETGTPYDVLRRIEKKTGIPIPFQLGDLEMKEKRFTDTIRKDDVADAVSEYMDDIMNIRMRNE